MSALCLVFQQNSHIDGMAHAQLQHTKVSKCCVTATNFICTSQNCHPHCSSHTHMSFEQQ